MAARGDTPDLAMQVHRRMQLEVGHMRYYLTYLVVDCASSVFE